MRTLSPAGGCVVIAVTRQMPGFSGSAEADSIVVFGSVTLARLSQDRTGFALGIADFGVTPRGGCTGKPPGPAPRPTAPVVGAPRPAPSCASAAAAAIINCRSNPANFVVIL